MIYVRIEMHPRGDKSRARLLGEMHIANDGTGTETTGNYMAILTRALSKSSEGNRVRAWKQARVAGFPRKRLGPYDLLYRVLKATVGTRNDENG